MPRKSKCSIANPDPESESKSYSGFVSESEGEENADVESLVFTKPSSSRKRKVTAMKEEEKDLEAERNVKKRGKKSDKEVVDVEAVKKEEAEDEEEEIVARFLDEAIPETEARKTWPNRYDRSLQEVIQANCHFVKAEVDGNVFSLNDDAFVKAEEGKESYICKIIEFFKAVDGSQYFTAQWYYRADDTVIKSCGYLIDNKRIFISEIKDENQLDCLIKKLTIVPLHIKGEFVVKEALRSSCDFYFDKKYLLPYSTFESLPSDGATTSCESGSTISTDVDASVGLYEPCEHSSELVLLDLYAGCGAMSTGLCLGANSAGVKLVTKWAVDINEDACKSLQLNHPETQVRNEPAEDFLNLLKEWDLLCKEYLPLENTDLSSSSDMENDEGDDNGDDGDADDGEVYEVEEILAIIYGDPAYDEEKRMKQKKTLSYKREPKLLFKIRWKGYGPEYDTWEPISGLSDCKDKLKEFVLRGHKSKILPLPGTVDVICGGPPCQGMSGFNRFRNDKAPLTDPKNHQLLVYMDIVSFLKPRYCLMENVVDMLKFANGFLGRYALGRLISHGYQARIGMMAAGNYGLPQFRMRMFMWGALPTERLPQYPLPTHYAKNRGVVPTEFEANAVAYEQGSQVKLKDELFLGDAISDLPSVDNNEKRDEMPYGSEPKTDFQRFIRLPRHEMPGCLAIDGKTSEHNLYDHRPYWLNNDDFARTCRIPKKKGANFRDLPCVRVRPDNKVEFNPDVKREYLPNGKPLVPDYAMTFVNGTSKKPFGRLWWDETVPTVHTRPQPHNHAILHPEQDRVLTVRENARLQGFPDYYQLVGKDIRERYMQVGNAVAVPVARALGYSLAMALKGLAGNEPVFTLPDEYPFVKDVPLADDMIDGVATNDS